ncbi:restriction endonuclease subunit S [Pallidibacillus thermolactis]|uniref:restriction endonuclease subunit S n=1 Tax=Pallidibacillus thermolactis TaxID=251051 RepID=UPI0021D9ABFB|nr:restriction endonuclease subunit S [Pallidibacillus thermolactis]MCU9600890.1 restriction endonuclease subunit S [Pallidibacillus thermolactis subsp. kokeshiiformis]
MVEKDSKYKKSRFGMIPVSWDEKPIGKIAKTSSGGTPKRDNKEFYEGGTINWFKTGELVTKYVYTSEEKITEQALKESSAKLFPKETLLVAMYGATIGKMSILKEDSATNQACCAILPNEKYNTEYLYYQLSFLKNKLINRGAGGAQPNISQDIIQTFPVPLPNKNEQQKIASILSTWDKAIELKEKLIEQKKEQKKGLMQKLLTGEVRLPGYSGDWKKVKLGEILKERKEIGYIELELLAITSSKGVVKRTEVDIKDNSSEDKSKYKRILPNDIGYNTMRMWQGVSGVSKYEGIVSPAYTILKPTNKVNSNFIGYLFKLPKIINLFRRYSQGLVSDTLNLKYENLKGIKVTIPQDVEEQKKIAEILLSIDNEIEMLQEYVNYLKQQKKGLMQLLLTGKVRVKV